MEIHNQPIQGPRPSRNAKGDAPIDITRPNREGIQRVKEAYEEEHTSVDSIELSEEARALAQKAQEAERNEEAEHQARVDELRKQYLEGRLNTPQRVDKAAEHLLLGE